MAIVFKNSYGTWDEIPHVIASKLIQSTEHYKDLNGKIKFDFTSKSEWKADHGVFPKRFTYEMTYRTEKIIIGVGYDYARAGHKRMTIQLKSPYDYSETFRLSNGDAKVFGCKDIEGILPRIKNAVDFAKPLIDATLEEKKNDNTKEANKQKVTDGIGEQLGVALTHSAYGHSLTYKQGKTFAMGIEATDKTQEKMKMQTIPGDKDLFSIDFIEGAFTLEEIQKIMEVVGGNPRALTERILGETSQWMK